ncbi:GlxA family transcriptional regulator [Actinoplanes regularis]|uniref:Transcriptional regulator, AraC family with amidase-like domain n=1 Tax=Actinoplanes regularis TaxID=52697 RepID=A0A238ZJI3_9ACTN|nr:helix-turn-helix domain-containing protein [Actinoplanes regularis]SNR83138.1 transcriptional regulator, AraC family with amidase-like domain [Actinoplanes regularis]
MRGHTVATLILPGAAPLDVGIPAQVFAPRHGLNYRSVPCAVQAGPVPGRDGLGLHVDAGLEALDEAGTIIVPGFANPAGPIDPRVLDALRTAAFRGTRIVSICGGAFALAAAGLLDGLRATTHWQLAPVLAREYPKVTVDGRVLFVDEGQVLTSAGVAAGIDLCLHLVRRDHGVQASNAIARVLVAAPYRSGGQSQYVPRTIPEPLGDVFAVTREWALRHLEEPLTVDVLARHAGVSARTFGRRFVQDTGYTPMQWVLRARVDLARELLERSGLGIDQIAARVGVGTGANLRMHFQRILGTSPSEYRKTFGGKLA